MGEEKTQGFWTSMPGLLTAVAAVITAVATLLPVLKQRIQVQPVPSKPGNDSGPKQPTPPSVAPAAPVQAPVVQAPASGFSITSVRPNVGPPLPAGPTVQIDIDARYTLETTPRAVLAIYLEEYPQGDPHCSGNIHHTNGSKYVPVTSGASTLSVALNWRHNPGERGFLSVGANLWRDSTGQAGTMIQSFPSGPAICMPFG